MATCVTGWALEGKNLQEGFGGGFFFKSKSAVFSKCLILVSGGGLMIFNFTYLSIRAPVGARSSSLLRSSKCYKIKVSHFLGKVSGNVYLLTPSLRWTQIVIILRGKHG